MIYIKIKQQIVLEERERTRAKKKPSTWKKTQDHFITEMKWFS